jgi:hypothetical protein
MAMFILSFADRSVQVFSRDEGFAEGNISKPRIYIKNTGDDTLTFLRYYYYFTTEDSKLPVFDDYYSPNVNITIEQLQDSLYRVKYEFSGNIFPGSMYPSEVENVIGLHYPDWSSWNKENDYSKSFGTYVTFLNATIPVYDENDSLLFGIEPTGTGSGGTPPPPPDETDSLVVIPAGSFPMGYYAAYGIESVNIADRDTIINGKIGSNTYIEVGCGALVKGDIVAGGNLFLREWASVEGSVQIAGVISRQNGTSISGSEADSAAYEPVQLPVVSVMPGTVNKTIPVNQSETVYPGAYNELIAYAGATVTLKPGTYSFNKFMLEPDVHLVAEINGGTPIIVNVQNMFRFADRCTVDFPIGKEYPMSLQFYTAQTEQVFIGNNVVFKGIVCAPEAEISVNSNTKVFGGVYGKRVVIQPNVTLCKPPVLADLYHSEITFAPSFDPLNTFYTTIISPDVTTLNVLPSAEDTGITVTVNGNSSLTPITLNGSTTDITIFLTDNSGCSATRYLLRVQRSPNYMIYVNDNSPCTPGAEDGETWSTAWKDLQGALDNAAATGREIWVAEGTYKPSARTIADDPRSGTFMVRAGIEIIGSFTGNETEKDPTGSPYRTILTGDLEGNDSLIMNWPPVSNNDFVAMAENSVCVITIKNKGYYPGCQLNGLAIKGGITDTLHFISGAGINCNGKLPDIQNCIFEKNYAVGAGAAVYTLEPPKDLINCLFRDNITVAGSGAAFYSSTGTMFTITGCIFDRNKQINSTELAGGGLVSYCDSIKIVNTVFTRNNAVRGGGALFLKRGFCKIINSTFSSNSSLDSAQSISKDSGSISVVNTILWNNVNKREIDSLNVTVNYSCITRGFVGVGNSTANPQFVNEVEPEGSDGVYGTTDDGLRLSTGSIYIDRGVNGPDIPTEDILYTEREIPDVGAYEYFIVQDFDKVFGYVNPAGTFIADTSLAVIDTIWHWWYVKVYAKSNYGLVAKITLKKDKYTRNIQQFYTNLYSLDEFGNEISGLPPVRINLYKVGEENGMLVFLSKTTTQGKPIVFVSEPLYHNWSNRWAYVICAHSANFRAITPNDQF